MDGLHRRDHLDTIPRPTLLFLRSQKLEKSAALLPAPRVQEVTLNSLLHSPRSYFPRAPFPAEPAARRRAAQP